MTHYTGNSQQRRRSLIKRTLVIIGIILLLGFAVATVIAMRAPADHVFKQPAQQTSTPPDTPETTAPSPQAVSVQPTIDSWIKGQSATYGIVVYDLAAKKVIGSNLPDQTFFAASLYKLFVAYLALEDIQAGKQNPGQPLTGGYTRLQCIDKMIRESHSSCGEAMMADMGPTNLEARVKAMGINNTTFRGIRTTAQDCALILQYIAEKRDLDDTRTAFLRDAMRTQEQKYKNGLAKGAPKATVDSKVGWNETANYHDVGIFIMPDKKEYVVAILSQNNGSSKPIANFAETLHAALAK